MFNITKNLVFCKRAGIFPTGQILFSHVTKTYYSNQKLITFSCKDSLSTGLRYRYFVSRHAGGFKKSWFGKGKKPKMYEVVDIAEVSTERRSIPDHIPKPEYATTGVIQERSNEIELKSSEEVLALRQSCALAKKVLDEVGKQVQVGRTTDELDYIVHSLCLSHGAYPSPLNYRGFPKSVCSSVNNIACHGIPDNRPLKNGDIVTLDVSVFLNGYHGDCAATFGVGSIDKEAQLLMEVALKCLLEAINICSPGRPLCDIGKTISAIARNNNFAVVPAFCGHGIGSYFHGPPSILHYDNDNQVLMQEGMVFTIEPVICEGEPDIVVLEDGWTAATEDNSRCAQYEHTILITKTGAEILTL